MRYLSLSQVLQLHGRIINQSGGILGILDLGLLESALRQPRMVFGGEELYPSLAEKASVLGFTIIHHHPFIDGNKHTAMPLWKYSELSREEFKTWIKHHLSPKQSL